jgi:hypothetical protein
MVGADGLQQFSSASSSGNLNANLERQAARIVGCYRDGRTAHRGETYGAGVDMAVGGVSLL